MHARTQWLILGFFAALLMCTAGGASLYVHLQGSAHAAAAAAQYKTPQEAQNIYVRFDMEAYDLILQHYWQKANDADLARFFQLSVEKAAASSSVALATSTRAGTAAMLEDVFREATSSAAQRQLAVKTLQVVLYNLPPVGHGQLLSKQQETSLRQEVSNVKPQSNLYGNLGVATTATQAQINTAYQHKVAAATSSAQKQQLSYAHQVLTNPGDKVRYDTAKIEPTVFSRVIGHTLYVDLSQMAPTTVQEFAEALDAASTTPGLGSMIIDLRGNLGGALGVAQALVGLFQGNNQYAFDLFHQGQYEVQRTIEPKFTELNRYKEIAVLTDDMTQSTAEVTAASLMRLHLAYTVGTTTRGWGSVESTYPLTTQIASSTSYALLLVQSLTLRPDNQPVEGNGVTPNVAVSDAHWRQELASYFSSASLVAAIKETVTKPPLRY